MRIDAHVHYMPPTLAQRLADFAGQEPYWGLLLAPRPGKGSIQGWATAERMLADMDQAGLDRVVLVGEYFQKHENCLARNDQALAMVRQWPDRIAAFAAIQPKAGAKAIAEIKRCLDGGLCGVGELNPYAQGYSMTDPDFLRVAESCLNYNLPLNLHTNEEVGPYYPGKSSTPIRHYYHLACRYPDLKLILAHWGGGLFFYEIMPKVRQALKNVWYDTAASPLLYPTANIFKVVLACLDQRKILYGSDYPLLLYPRKQRQPDFRFFIEELQALHLPPAVYDDLMGHNMARLLGLLDTEQAHEQINSAMEPMMTEGPGESRLSTESARQPEVSPEGSDPLSTEGKMIDGWMAAGMVAEAWPETRPVLEKFGIPWQDKVVPVWEPLIQAAAAQGWAVKDQQRLLDELNHSINSDQKEKANG